MGHSIFGWDLPPGCSMADIDHAFGDQPTMLEVFEGQHKGKLTPQEQELLNDLLEKDCDSDFIEKVLSWSYKLGYDACLGDEEECRFYKSKERQRVKIPKLRAYFKSLRGRKETK